MYLAVKKIQSYLPYNTRERGYIYVFVCGMEEGMEERRGEGGGSVSKFSFLFLRIGDT